jgi:molecular chaperone GrpE
VPADARQAVEGALKSVLEGIELTERDLINTLERHGIKKLDPVGQKFDPNFHQAMMEIQDANVPSGTVTQVIQTGFAIGERVLRPALVGVAKGGPKADAAPASKPH